jgi:hypothetical protein
LKRTDQLLQLLKKYCHLPHHLKKRKEAAQEEHFLEMAAIPTTTLLSPENLTGR